MEPRDYIALVSPIIATTALAFSVAFNIRSSGTKRYELTGQYRESVLEWFSYTTQVLIKLKLLNEAETLDQRTRIELLAQLSSQIEVGRFYFPNIDKGDLFGNDKPLAYRGYRHVALDFLVFSYSIYIRDDATKYLAHAEELRRHFTSHIFELLQPAKYNKSISKKTAVTFDNDSILEEFLSKDPKSFVFYS